MSISPFFLNLSSAYQSEIDDLTFDSEGRDVLRRRLAEKRGEISFLIQMMEISPEMVAVVFHQGLAFSRPAVMDRLLGLEVDDLPRWSSLAEGIEWAPWAADLVQVILKAPGGEWFMVVAAGVHYMAGKLEAARLTRNEDTESAGADEDGQDSEDDHFDLDEDGDESGRPGLRESARARNEAGADWLVAQGFDRKD